VRGIAWPWFVLIGTTLTFGTGLISSLFSSASPPRDASASESAV